MTKFLLDSGSPQEYKEIQKLAQKNGSEIWGATTNPTLIAKQLLNKKLTQKEAFELQKKIVLEILDIVPGAVSAEVYADQNTKAQDMIKQGREISKWHKRVVVKLPTTIEGFKARTALRQESICVNNTLVFSQQQVFAICLHEQIIQKIFGPTRDNYPPFISPFVGRLDDVEIDGMMLIENSMKIKRKFNTSVWMLVASVRKTRHIKRGLDAKTELVTAPGKVYKEWFNLSDEQRKSRDLTFYALNLKPVEYWKTPKYLFAIDSIAKFMEALESGRLDIRHPLTEKGIILFTNDWKAILKK